MRVMIVGLILFLGLHLVPTMQPLRRLLVAKAGVKAYSAIFALGSALGLVLIVAGYWHRPPRVQLFAPYSAARAAAPLLVTIAFVLFASANMKTHIRKWLQHPMLIGLLLWSGVHLLANGDLAGTILFGAFLAYSIVALVSAIQRHTVKPFAPAWKFDAIAVAAGLGAAYLTIRVHPALFG
jgi:uncharacterized membrane protein